MTEALSYFDSSVVNSQNGSFSLDSRPTFSNEFMPLNPISYVPNRWIPVQKSVEGLLGMIVISNRQGFDRATYYSIYNQLVELLQEVDQLDPDKLPPATQKAQTSVQPTPMMPCAPADLVWPDRSGPSSTDLPNCLPLAFESPSFGSARMPNPSPSQRSSRSINVGVSTPPSICISLPPHHLPTPTMLIHATQLQNPLGHHVVVQQQHQHQHQQHQHQQPQQQVKVVAQSQAPVPVKVKKQPSPLTPDSPAVIKISSSDSSPTSSPPTNSCALAAAASGSTQQHLQQQQKRVKQRKPRNLVCAQCGTSTTPEWRKGPSGDHSLCNACGLMYAKRLKKERLEMGLEPPPPRKRKDLNKTEPMKGQPQQSQQQSQPQSQQQQQHCDQHSGSSVPALAHPSLLMDSPPVQLELQTHLEQLPNVELPSEPPLSPLMCLSGENSPINC